MPERVFTHPTMALVEASPGYELLDPQDHLNDPPPPMVVQDFLPAGSVVGLTSPPGTGKTWLAFELMRIVSQGANALGHFPSDPGGVLFIGSDSSLHDYARQWKRLTLADRRTWNESESLDKGPRPFANVRWLVQSSFALDRPETVARVIKTHLQFHWATEPIFTRFDEWDPIEERFVQSEEPVFPSGFKLIVMDTFSRVYMGDQNSAAETDRAMGHARLIAEATGACVLVLHHNAKKSEFNDGETWRGSSAMQGSLDAWLNLTQSKYDKFQIRGTWKKFRGITPPDFDYKMRVDDPKTASLLYTASSTDGDIEEDALSVSIIQFLTTKPNGATTAEIREATWGQFQDVWKGKDAFNKAVVNRTSGNLPLVRKLIQTKQGVGKPSIYKLKPVESTDEAQ